MSFEHTTPPASGSTGSTLRVPIVAPILGDLILRDVGTTDLKAVHVTAFAQEL